MTTIPLDNPLVDFSRAGFASFDVPQPVRALATDSIIEENRKNTPQSAINQRKQERLTVSELNDMDMDEITKRYYGAPIDTRGPVTRFLDMIDLPRNVLFNLAAGDTARRKAAQGDTAALGLARVNTSDVLESLGVRPGLATGILGFVGDVALDPLTYLGPAGWGAKLTSTSGRTASLTRAGSKAVLKTIDEVEAGTRISDDLARNYLEKAGYTAERMAAATDKKALAAEVSDVLGKGKQTRFNKLVSFLGEDKEFDAIEGVRTLADDITDYIPPNADELTKARITASKDFYKAYGRPFSPGLRVVKDPNSAIGFSFTTSKSAPKGSGIFHIPGTAYEISVPAFTPGAIQQVKIASLVENAAASGEFFNTPEMKAVYDMADFIDDAYNNHSQGKPGDPVSVANIMPAAGAPVDIGDIASQQVSMRRATRRTAEVGDDVQWTSQGVQQFAEPRKITSISPDGNFAFVEGSSTGLPMRELNIVEPLDESAKFKQKLANTLKAMQDAIKSIEANPNASYADLLHARDLYRKSYAEALSINDDLAKARGELEEAKGYASRVNKNVNSQAIEEMLNMRVEARTENQVRKERRAQLAARTEELKQKQVEEVSEEARYNPASPLDETHPMSALKARWEKQQFKIEDSEVHSDPAKNTKNEQVYEWKEYRTAEPGTEKYEESVAKIVPSRTNPEAEQQIAELRNQYPEIMTDEQIDEFDQLVKEIDEANQEQMPEEAINDFLAEKDSNAFTYFQQAAYNQGLVRTKFDAIDLNKVQVGDQWTYGTPDLGYESPLVYTVTEVLEDGKVRVKVDMPRKRPKEYKWGKRFKKDESQQLIDIMATQPSEYYLLNPETAVFATRGRKGTTTVRRMKEVEGAQAFSGDLQSLKQNQKFTASINQLVQSVKVRKNIMDKAAAGQISDKILTDSLNDINGRMSKSATRIATQIHELTKNDVPDISIAQIENVVSEEINRRLAILDRLKDDDIIDAVQAKLFANPVPPKYKPELFGTGKTAKVDYRLKAMEELGIDDDDLIPVRVGAGTKYEGLTPSQIRQQIVKERREQALREIRFQHHPEVKTAYDADLAALTDANAAAVDRQAKAAKAVNAQLHNRTLKVDKAIRTERAKAAAAVDPTQGMSVDEALRLANEKDWREPFLIEGTQTYKQDIQTIDGLNYELFKPVNPNEKKGFIKITKAYTGDLVGQYPFKSFEEALNSYNDVMARNGGNEVSAADLIVTPESVMEAVNRKQRVEDFAAETERLRQQAPDIARKEILAEIGESEDALDPVIFGKGTEYEGMDEQQIRNAIFEKHAKAYDARVPNDDVPNYMTEAEMQDLSAYADYLHAKAKAAAMIADASSKPYLAAAGSGVHDAVVRARDAWGLGADDMGSGVMASLSSITEHFANQGTVGRIAFHNAKALERTLVNRLGLDPGIANDVVKQYVRAQDIQQTQAFRMAVTDMQKTLGQSGLPIAQHGQAFQLALALIFAGDIPIDQMAKLAERDKAYKIILESMKGGLLDPSVNPQASEAIKALAQKYKQILNQLDDGSGIQNYIPNVLTAQAREFLRFQRENRANLIASKKVGPSGELISPVENYAERFEKPRSTIEHTWVDENEEVHTLMESELAYLEYSDNTIKDIENSNPEYANYIRARKNSAERWQNLTEVQRQGAETYYLSPFEINRRVKEYGMFKNLTNNALNGRDFMYSDLITAVGIRLGEEERKAARNLLQQYLAPYELRVDNIKLTTSGTAGGKGRKFTTTNGTEVDLVNEDGKQVIYIGNEKYRQPKIDIAEEFSVMSSLFTAADGTRLQAAFYPEKIADIIEDTAGFFGKPGEGSGFAKAFEGKTDPNDMMSQILKGAEKVTQYWKVFTLLHPSWTVNDIVGNFFLAANMGINPKKMVKNARDTYRFVVAMARGDTEALSKMTIAGKSGLDHAAGDIGMILDTGQVVETTQQMRRTGEFVDPYAYSILRAMKKLAKGDIQGAREEFAGAMAESYRAAEIAVAERRAVKPGTAEQTFKPQVMVDAAFDKVLVRRVWQGWAHANGIANNWMKAAAYFSLLEDGYDGASAARRISEMMLDMSVLTSTDRAARKVFPFYNWMKHSGVLGAREFLRNPKFFTIAPKIKQALEESLNGEENLPENARPSWIRDQLALQIGTDPDTRRALTLTSSLPTEAATYAISFLASPVLGWGALQDSLAYVTNALNPVVKMPLELGARKEFFTKRVISSDGGDITPTEYLLQQVRPFRELGIGSLRGGPLQRAFADDPILGVSRLMIGGRLQPFEEERRVQNLQREYDERVDALRRRIGIAERESQKNESLARRVELLRLFNQMEGLGLTIPKWASKQIKEVNQTQASAGM
jgi:hypothetical protein